MYDMVLKGAHVVDPVSGVNDIRDVAIRAGKVEKLAETIPVVSARESVDLTGLYVFPGLVDMHVHVSEWLGGQFGHKMLAEAGITTVLDMSGPIDGVLKMASRYGAGLNIASIEYVRPRETVTGTDPSRKELVELLNTRMEKGSIGLKLLGGHYPLTPESTATAIEVANSAKSYVAFHAGSLATGSTIEGMLEAVKLANGNAMHLAHVNSYCRGAVRDYMQETEEAIDALIANPNIRSESYLGLVNGTSAGCVGGLPESMVTRRCLITGGFAATEEGLEEAILKGWAQINMEVGGRVVLATGTTARDYWRGLGTNAPVSFKVNPPEPRIRLATAKGPRGFVVDALSTDGGGIPRNVLVPMGLALVKLEALSIEEFVLKASYNPAQILGLKNKGHLSPGADADITVVDFDQQCPVMTMVGGKISMYRGLVIGTSAKIVTTERGVKHVSSLGLEPVVVDMLDSSLYRP